LVVIAIIAILIALLLLQYNSAGSRPPLQCKNHIKDRVGRFY
jgi:hypothetical protein